MRKTDNLDLNLFDGTDLLDYAKINDNMTILDESVQKTGTQLSDLIVSVEKLVEQGNIRHIQRGCFYYDTDTSITSIIPLSGFTDINKMVVYINGTVMINGGDYEYSRAQGIYVKSLTLNSLSIEASTYLSQQSGAINTSGNVSYQVVEYY